MTRACPNLCLSVVLTELRFVVGSAEWPHVSHLAVPAFVVTASFSQAS